jgi:transcriptional regulator
MGRPQDILQGTLDLLILRAIQLEPLHGWAIAKRIHQLSSDRLRVQQGSLYPALYRLERDGWIKGRTSDNEGRVTKVYSLTRAGAAHLKTQVATWERLSEGVNLVIRHA